MKRGSNEYAVSFTGLNKRWLKMKDKYGWNNPKVKRFLDGMDQTGAYIDPFPLEDTINRKRDAIIDLVSPEPQKKRKPTTHLNVIGADEGIDTKNEIREIELLLSNRTDTPMSSKVRNVPVDIKPNYDENASIIIIDDDDTLPINETGSGEVDKHDATDSKRSTTDDHELYGMSASICGSVIDDDDDDYGNDNGNAHISNKEWKAIHRRRSRSNIFVGEGTSYSPIILGDSGDVVDLVGLDGESSEISQDKTEEHKESCEESSDSDSSDDSDDYGYYYDDDDDSFIVPDDEPLEYYDDDDITDIDKPLSIERQKDNTANTNTNEKKEKGKSTTSKKERASKKEKTKENANALEEDIKTHMISFRKDREAIANALLRECNKVIFGKKFKEGDVSVKWSNMLRTTAGMCEYIEPTRGRRPRAEITISTKVCDRYKRLKSTLVHEMCHAAVFLLDKAPHAQYHGKLFKKWGSVALEKYGVRVERTHDYAIHYKHQFVCSKCEKRYGTNVLYDVPACPECGAKLKHLINK